MASEDAASSSTQHGLLKQILFTVQSIQQNYQHLSTVVESIQGQINVLSGIKRVHDAIGRNHLSQARVASTEPSLTGDQQVASDTEASPNSQASSLKSGSAEPSEARSAGESLKQSATATSRIILTTYPGQSGIDPLNMIWGHVDALQRGPVAVSRSQSTIRRRNGKRRLLPIIHGISDFCLISNRCSWRLILHLSCIGRSKQTCRCGS